jgi:hypothetical protein
VYPQSKFCLQILPLQSWWCACVQSLLVLCEGTDAICRQSNLVYASSCVFTVFKKIEKPTACKIWSVIRFLNAGNMKPADIHCQLCEVYGEHAMIDLMVQRWVRHFNEGCENVHDDPRSSLLSVVEDLVRAVGEKIQGSRRFTNLSLPCIFHKFHGHFFMKLCLKNFVFGNCVHAGCRRCLRKNTKWNSRPVCWPSWHDTVSKAMTSWAA